MKKKIKINKERCKGCMLCIEVCPKKTMVLSGKVNKKGMRFVEIKDSEKCSGCALCALVCPDCAIEVIEGKKK